MFTYTFRFFGRKKDAIGIAALFAVPVVASTYSEALDRLYREYEHCHQLQLVSEEPTCSNYPDSCASMYNCCTCESGECGCAYCWSCNCCDACK